MSPTTIILALVSTALAILRILGHRSPAFQAVAHLFVGGLFGAWIADRASVESRAWLGLAVALSVVELACFLAMRG